MSQPSTARLAGAFYLLTIVTGVIALAVRGAVGAAAGLAAAACYVGVTILFYFIFKSVSARLSLLAACISIAGCITGAMTLRPMGVQLGLVLFGFYCLLIGYLIVKSTFLPRFLGALMAFAGLGWLTFLSPALARALSPYNFGPGIIGEGTLCLWLLIAGVKPTAPASSRTSSP